MRLHCREQSAYVFSMLLKASLAGGGLRSVLMLRRVGSQEVRVIRCREATGLRARQSKTLWCAPEYGECFAKPCSRGPSEKSCNSVRVEEGGSC